MLKVLIILGLLTSGAAGGLMVDKCTINRVAG